MDWANNPQVRETARAIAKGGVVAYPTEAVWGLGCDPHNPEAVHELLRLKQRPVEKGLILVAASMEQLEPYLAGLDLDQRKTLESTWPGPVTWLVPDNGAAPVWIRGEHKSVALRVSAHPVVAGLCQAYGGPVVSTSANPAGLREARDAGTVQGYFGQQLAALAPGEVGQAAKPTEIRDLLTGAILRGG